MNNKRVLQIATKELNKRKAPPAPKDIITDPAGQWKFPGQVTRIPSNQITMQGVNYPVLGVPDKGEPTMMYPGGYYNFPDANYVDEYPQMQEGGTTIPTVEDAGSTNEDGFWVPDWEAIAMQAKQLNAKTVKTKSGAIIYFDNNWQVQSVDDNPQMKKGGGLKSKKYTNNIMGTSYLFAQSDAFKKPKKMSKKRIFDPNAKYYQDGGIMTQDEIDGATEGMMKARLAYEYMHGNPAAQRMVVAPDQPYVFDHGDTGTHFMASMDDYAVPLIQDVNGQLMLGDFGPESAEAMRFDNPEDAMYFAEHYKDVSPAFIEADLTPEEIQEYAKGGYVIEELDGYAEGGDPGDVQCPPGYIKVNGKCKKVDAFVTSDPKEYAYRKAAYDDSLNLYNLNKNFRDTAKKYFFTEYNHLTKPSTENSKAEAEQWKKLIKMSEKWDAYKRISKVPNKPSGAFANYGAGYTQAAGDININAPGTKVLKKKGDVVLIKNTNPGYQKPVQPVQFKKEQPSIVEKEVIEPTPVPQPTPIPTPVMVNPELQKFVEEKKPEPPGPPPGTGTDVMPVYDTEDLPEYATPDPDAQWVGQTERHIDWNANRIPYRLPRFRKPGHGGDLIKPGKRRYIPIPGIETRHSGYIQREDEEYGDGGERKNKNKNKNVKPFVTSDPEEYAYRKAAYDDSSHLARKYNPQQPKAQKYTKYDGISGVDFKGKAVKVKKGYMPSNDNIRMIDMDYSRLSPAWQNFIKSGPNRIHRYNFNNVPIGHQWERAFFDTHAMYTPFGVKTFTLPGEEQLSDVSIRPRFQPPVQPVKFVSPDDKKKNTSKKDLIKKPVPKVSEEPLPPAPVEEKPIMPIPPGIPPTPPMPEPPSGYPGIMPQYDIDEVPMYATPDPDAEWVGNTERYIDWDGNSVGYNLPRVRKPGHGGDLIRKGKRRYLHLPSIETRYQAEIIPEEEYAMGGQYNEGDEVELTEAEVKRLRSLGYIIEEA